MSDVFIVEAVRTPVGKYRGSLAGVRADHLGAHVLNAVVERAGISAGEDVTLAVTIRNLGDAPAATTSAVGVFVDEAFEACVTTDPAGGWTAVRRNRW